MSKDRGSGSSLKGLDKVLQDGQNVLGFAYLGIVGGLPVPYLVEGMFLRWRRRPCRRLLLCEPLLRSAYLASIRGVARWRDCTEGAIASHCASHRVVCGLTLGTSLLHEALLSQLLIIWDSSRLFGRCLSMFSVDLVKLFILWLRFWGKILLHCWSGIWDLLQQTIAKDKVLRLDLGFIKIDSHEYGCWGNLARPVIQKGRLVHHVA